MKASHLKNTDKLELIPLEFKFDHLEPVLEEDNVKYHYQVLSQGYVDRYNNQEGDLDFNKAGAYLHRIWWENLTSPNISNKPKDKILELIEKKYTTFSDLKEKITEKALKLQGSGWIYLSKTGDIKIIHNHKIEKDIIMILDLWEHSMNPFQTRKEYIKTIWQIIDWNVVNNRLISDK